MLFVVTTRQHLTTFVLTKLDDLRAAYIPQHLYCFHWKRSHVLKLEFELIKAKALVPESGEGGHEPRELVAASGVEFKRRRR